MTYLMQDACQASANALHAVYLQTYLLMCWYHLKARIEINIKDVQDKSLHAEILRDINSMHYSWSYDRYCEVYSLAIAKWDRWDSAGVRGMEAFKEYFNKQWICSDFRY